MEARNRSVKDWFAKIRMGQIVLPSFQRFEAWGSNEIATFLTSIIRGLPVGTALVLGVSGNPLFRWRTIKGAPEPEEGINELLLDGQQRLTALWRSLKDDYPDKTFFVELEPENEEEPRVVYVARWEKNGKRYPLWANNPDECWKRKYIPVKLLDPDNEYEYLKWVDEAAQDDLKVAREIEREIYKLREKIANYNIPYLYLSDKTKREVAIDIFIKLNTNLVRLTPFDIIVAEMEEETGESLHEYVNAFRREVPRIEEYTEPSTFILSVASLLQDKPPSQKGFFQIDFSKFIEEWNSIVEGSKALTEFLEEEGVFDNQRLPTESVLAPLAALWTEAPREGDHGGNTRTILRKYMWRAFFTNRYDKSVPTAVFQDYKILKKVLKGEEKPENVPIFDEQKYPLPTKDQLKSARWPKYRDRLSRAILLLSIRGGAEDLANGSKISPENIKYREYHHVYPAKWIKENYGNEYEEKANIALNCILITWKTNRILSSKDPLTYLKERCNANFIGEEEIRRRLKTHFIDFEYLAKNNYDKFLEYRAENAENAIRELCIGKSWLP